jgi:K+-sensing histidine kinase KdpD
MRFGLRGRVSWSAKPMYEPLSVKAVKLLIEADAVRESNRLKSVLLDAIAHDFKTPVTSIKAAVTILLGDARCNKRQKSELLVVIDEECDRIATARYPHSPHSV